MAAKSQDKILLGVAVVVLIASAAWTWMQSAKVSAARKADAASVTATNYAPTGLDAPKVSTSTWPQPPSQPSGALWVYDVFTPPEIYYDKLTKQFTVTPPITGPIVDPKPIPFGLQLVQVRQDAFRLQLVGYVGQPGDYRGTFQNMVTGDTVMGVTGKAFPALGLTVKNFEVKRIKTTSKESMAVYTTVATAIITDTKTGDEITLTNKERMIKGTPFAIFKADGQDATIEQKAGGKFTVGTATYTVVNVTAEPASAEVLKESPDLTEPSTKTLTPSGPVAPVPATETPKATVAPSTTPAAFPFPTGL